MIKIRLTAADIGRMRFACSPLTEAAESLYMLASPQRIHPVHRGWFNAVQHRLAGADLALLRAVVPARPYMASFLFGQEAGRAVTIEDQLQAVADMPNEELRTDLAEVWAGETMPAPAASLIRDGAAGSRRLADALWTYWEIAIEPHWRAVRAILDEDVAHRAVELTKHGLGGMLADIHDQVSLENDTLQIHKTHSCENALAGAALRLVPSVFVWPNVIFAIGGTGPATLFYPVRGVGTLWETISETPLDEDGLGALLGRSRAAILICLAVPQSTTELSLRLGQSPPAVSQHLSVLRRAGLVTSWRAGRSVMYRRTDLAGSIVDTCGRPVASGYGA